MDQTFTVTVPDSVEGLNGLEPGSQLILTGVCLITYDEYRQAQSFRILLRRSSDVVVESRPPWWTVRHALWIIGAMLISVIAALGWITVLRRHVATWTNELREANERLYHAAAEDALTGAANRRRFDEILETEVDRGAGALKPVSLIIADIDHFKAMNDLYGHQRGDRCLIKVVHALKISVPPGNQVVARLEAKNSRLSCRIQGTKQPPKSRRQCAGGVADLAIPHSASPFNERLSISLGVATLWPGSTYTADDLVAMADRALYHARQNGRNCVVSSDAVTVNP